MSMRICMQHRRTHGSMMVNGTDCARRSGSARGLPAAYRAAGASAAVGGAGRLRLMPASAATAGFRPGAAQSRGAEWRSSRGPFDLMVVNPFSKPGLLLRGKAALNADIKGTLSQPDAQGSIEISHADLQDYPRGLHLTSAISAARWWPTAIRLQLQQLRRTRVRAPSR